MIHPTAVIHPTAEIAADVKIGAFSIVGEGVKIGSGTVIHPHVIIESHTILGSNNEIFPGTVIGAPPQDLSWKGEFSRVIIGDRNIIREQCTIHKASKGGVTSVGDGNFLMVGFHAGHNVQIGCGCVIANSVALAGYVEVEDKAVFGGLAAVHQFARIGSMAMVGGLSRIAKDVPPFVKVDGNPSRIYGLNLIGLKRNGIPPERRELLKKAYNLVYRSKMNLSQAVSAVEKNLEASPEVSHFLRFIKNASRQGILRNQDDKVYSLVGEQP